MLFIVVLELAMMLAKINKMNINFCHRMTRKKQKIEGNIFD